jgi:hypothetical protein
MEKEKENLKKTANKNIKEILWKWFVSVGVKNHHVSCPMVQEYAKTVTEILGRLNPNHLMNGLKVFQKTSESELQGESSDV